MALECERWQWRELFASEHGPSDPSTRLVLFVLALHMNQQGENAFPSQQTIAQRAGLSERSVRTHLAHAEKAGWVKIYQKPRKGQAWFVHEYVATIPDRLAELCTPKPWEENPTWQRAANSAGRSKEASALSRPPVSPGLEHPANGAGRPAILAGRPANASATPGKIFRDARQGLPTNSSSNSSMNSPKNSPIEGAVASDRTDVSKNLNEKPSKAPDSEVFKEAYEERSSRIRKAIKDLVGYGDADLARVAGVTLAEVQQHRRQA